MSRRARVFAFAWLTVALPASVARPDQPPAKPDCTVSDARATAAPPAASKIPVDTRRAIFVDLQQVVARAQREAATRYPTAEGGALLSPTNVQKDSKLTKKRDTAALSLERTYLADVLKQRSLTCAAARDIMREGRDARWPTQKQEVRP